MLSVISAALAYALLSPTLPLPSNPTRGAQQGCGEKSSQCSQRDQAQKQTDRRLLLTPAGATSDRRTTENGTIFFELHQRKVDVAIHRKELILACYSRA